MEVLTAIAQLLPSLGGWIADLVSSGMSHDDAAKVIKRDIESRRAEVAADREKRAEEFRKKHGEPL